MRVGLIIYDSLDITSGGNIYDRHLINILKERDPNVERVDLISLPRTSYPGCLAHNVSVQLLHRLQHADLDVLLQDELVYPSLFWFNRRLRHRVTFPCVGIVHHLQSSEVQSKWRKSYQRPLEHFYLKGLDAFIVNSHHTKRAVQAIVGGAPPCMVAQPGGNRLIPSLTIDRIRARSCATGSLRLLFVGNVIPRKGLTTLIAALEKLVGHAWHLDVVGSKDVDLEYTKQIRLQVKSAGLEQQISFHGHLGDSSLFEYFSRSHVLTVPSTYEGFGIVYLEGMGFGLPALACQVGAVSEIIEHGANGFLIPPGDVSKLTHYIEQLIQNRSLLENLSVNAHRTYHRHPTWQESLVQVPNFLTKVISLHRTIEKNEPS
jgi:glycosyltransferase involved in cell wall biosynthesis